MTTAPTRIVVVDDNQSYRKTICSILRKNPNLQVIGEAEDGLAGIQAAEKLRPNVVLMDINMPVMDGIDATWVIRSKFPEVRVVVLTMYDVDFLIEAAHKSGAFLCLNKECSPKEIIQAVMTAGI